MGAAVYMLYAYSLEKKHGYVCTVIFSILAMYTHNIALVGVFGAFVAVLLFSLFTALHGMLSANSNCDGLCPFFAILISNLEGIFYACQV